MISNSRYGCASARNSGTCQNRKTVRRSDVEERVLAAQNGKVLAPVKLGGLTRAERQGRKCHAYCSIARACDLLAIDVQKLLPDHRNR
jgi:hypothetical protein